ncbi:uncharacterized protein G2W53_044188 [Senna tora]|uniref:Uncharacterized protein n=1 Tax=Senna tora TaxID=362788 RepID=A0A834SK17_9FABA|nr:uncharacterized protein G2W53_044188 [Senna tora]
MISPSDLLKPPGQHLHVAFHAITLFEQRVPHHLPTTSIAIISFFFFNLHIVKT